MSCLPLSWGPNRYGYGLIKDQNPTAFWVGGSGPLLANRLRLVHICHSNLFLSRMKEHNPLKGREEEWGCLGALACELRPEAKTGIWSGHFTLIRHPLAPEQGASGGPTTAPGR